jgi:hypothetical protein
MENQVSNHRQDSNQTWQGKLMHYIQGKLQIPATALSNIGWQSHAQAIRTIPIPSRTFLIKFLYRWLTYMILLSTPATVSAAYSRLRTSITRSAALALSVVDGK